MDTIEACVKGTGTVQLSIFGSTLTSIVVFLPLIFIKGLIGALFKEMAFTISFSLLSSILIAIFLLPMLASLELKKDYYTKKESFKGLKAVSDGFYKGLEKGFITVFKGFFNKRKFFIVFSFGLFVLAVLLFGRLDSELMPKVKENYLNLWVKMPEGTTIDDTQNAAKNIIEKLKTERFVLKKSMEQSKIPPLHTQEKKRRFITRIFTTIGYEEENLIAKMDSKVGRNMANFIIYLDDSINSEKAYELLEEEIFVEKAEKVVLSEPADIVTQILSKEDKPILITVEGKNTKSIIETTKLTQQEIAKVDGIKNVSLSYNDGKPEVKVNILRQKSSLFGLNAEMLSGVLKAALTGEKISKFYEGDQNTDIRVRLREQDRNSLKQLKKMLIPTPGGFFVSLEKIATISDGFGTDLVLRENQADIIQIKADFDREKYSSYGEAKAAILPVIHKIKKDLDNFDVYNIELRGENERFEESFSQLIFMFLLSIIFIYMIIASLFESLGNPLILMLSVPLGLIGVAPALLIAGLSLNIMSGMGMIMLGGITINSAVVLLEFIKQEEQLGRTPKEAVFNAGKIRLRPIIMSVFTTVLGLLPLSLALGKGSDMQQPLALAVIGGLIVSTFLTLLLIPSLYYSFNTFRKKKY